MVNKMVTPTQQKIYTFVCQYIEQKGYSPSLVEIANGIGISANSISLVSRGIHALIDAGKLKFYKKGYRNLQVATQALPSLALPVVGRIAAGEPIEALAEAERYVDFARLLNDDRFVLEVKGDSMVEEGILDGDFVICRSVRQAQEGDIIVALIDGQEATLKRVSYKIPERITLIPANPALKPKAYLPHRVEIQGVLVGLLRLNA